MAASGNGTLGTRLGDRPAWWLGREGEAEREGKRECRLLIARIQYIEGAEGGTRTQSGSLEKVKVQNLSHSDPF